MNPDNLPKAENEQYEPNLEAQDEEVVSGGNNRLIYILVGVLVVIVLAYVALPKGSGGGLASATPSFMLDDAAVTAKNPTSEDSIAAGLKAAPVVDAAAPAVIATSTKTIKTTAAPSPATEPATASEVVAPAAAPVAAPEPAQAPAPAAAAPAPVAPPANVSISGKIDDENGHPLVGATVLLKGSSKGTSTDANGNYTLEVPAGDNTLIFGYGGYDDEEMRTRGAQSMNVTLTPRAKTGKKRR